MAKTILSDIKYRQDQTRKFTVQEVDNQFFTLQAQTLASSNSLMYFGPSPSNSGWTISNTYYPYNPKERRFSASILPNSQNSLGGQTNINNGATISFVFSATSSGASASTTLNWWYNLRDGYKNMVFSLSDVFSPSNVWEYKIATMSYNSSSLGWQLAGTKLSGPTGSALDPNSAYMISYKTTQVPGVIVDSIWTASIPMQNGSFPYNMGSWSDYTIATPNDMIKITSAIIQFVYAVTYSASSFPGGGYKINLQGGEGGLSVLASATFSGPNKTIQKHALIPKNIYTNGDSNLYLTGDSLISGAGWGGITFSNTPPARISVVLTYQKIYSPDNGLIDEVA